MAAAAVPADRHDARFLTKCLHKMWMDAAPRSNELPKPEQRRTPLRPQEPRNWLVVLPACARGPLIPLHDKEKVQP
jgi:hypothetical protein